MATTRGRLIWSIVIAGALVAGAGVCVAWLYRPAGEPEPEMVAVEPEIPVQPEAETAEPKDVIRYLASDTFASLPEEEQYAYFRKLEDRGPDAFMRHMRENELSDEEFEKIRKNVGPLFRRRMKERIDEYFALPKEERPAALDKMIDQMQKARQEREARMAQMTDEQREAQAAKWRGRGMTIGRMRQRLEETDPETRAQFMQFMLDMSQRMLERNIEPRPPGR